MPKGHWYSKSSLTGQNLLCGKEELRVHVEHLDLRVGGRGTRDKDAAVRVVEGLKDTQQLRRAALKHVV